MMDFAHEQTKTFGSGRDCQIKIKFPNGNLVSCIWGFGSYTDNHFPNLRDWDMTKGEFGIIGLFHPLKESKTIECMYECDEITQSKINDRFPDEDNPIGQMDFEAWWDLLVILKG